MLPGTVESKGRDDYSNCFMTALLLILVWQRLIIRSYKKLSLLALLARDAMNSPDIKIVPKTPPDGEVTVRKLKGQTRACTFNMTFLVKSTHLWGGEEGNRVLTFVSHGSHATHPTVSQSTECSQGVALQTSDGQEDVGGDIKSSSETACSPRKWVAKHRWGAVELRCSV